MDLDNRLLRCVEGLMPLSMTSLASVLENQLSKLSEAVNTRLNMPLCLDLEVEEPDFEKKNQKTLRLMGRPKYSSSPWKMLNLKAQNVM